MDSGNEVTVRLYDYWRSSAAYRVRIALNLKGLTYEAIDTSLLHGEQRAPDYVARNPQGLVPMLEVGDLRLTQSLAIID
jgi:glutathione S-transferase